jgi:hypothetical protein
LVEEYNDQLSKISEEHSKRYKEVLDKPILMITMLVNELVEDATSVLEIGCLPDESNYKEMKEKYGQDEEEKLNANPKLMNTYKYSQDLKWKYDILEMVMKAYNEPMLNLHFLGPYLKNHCASQNSYD